MKTFFYGFTRNRMDDAEGNLSKHLVEKINKSLESISTDELETAELFTTATQWPEREGDEQPPVTDRTLMLGGHIIGMICDEGDRQKERKVESALREGERVRREILEARKKSVG